jgi:DNA polymerase bacteriophage-type
MRRVADYLFYDLESKSQVDLRKVGTYVYAAHKSTELLCAALALDDEPTELWTPDKPLPKKFAKHIEKGGLLVAHGAQFERQMHINKLGPVHGWPIPKLEQFRCSQAMALALALPPALENIAPALGVEMEKDKVGKRVMLQMTKPRKAKKGEDPDEVHWYDDEERHEKLQGYCVQDVDVSREVFNVMWPLSDDELNLWRMDQIINDRGFYIDQDLLMAMRRIITDAGEDVDNLIRKATNEQVQTVGQVAQIKSWLETEHGVFIKSLSKTVIPDLLSDPSIPQAAKDVLELRIAGAQAAVKKVDAFLSRRDKDGRVRGSFLYHSAGTGRWASRGAQVHNLKRLTSEEEDEILDAVKDLQTGDYKFLKTKYARPLKIVGDNIRTVIRAAPGNVLIGADFSGIEARVTAWLAGEVRKLQVFRDYDAGKGPDPYVAAAADIFGTSAAGMAALKISDPNDYKVKRQGGKGAELAFGFGGAENAYKKFMPVTMLANPGAWQPPKAPPQNPKPIPQGPQSKSAIKNYGTGFEDGAAAKQAKDAKVDPALVGKFTDVQITDIKVKWRKAHPNICKLWYAMGDAGNEIAKKASWIARGVDQTIEDIQVGRLTFEYSPENGGFMFMVLPSGRRIAYPGINRAKDYRERYFIEKPKDTDEPVGKMTTYFMDNSAGRFHRVFVWHGILIENAVQGIARDLLAAAIMRVEAAGFPIVVHVHDEAVIEVSKKIAKKVMAEFVRLMCMLPDWAQDDDPDYALPVVAKGWMAERYIK